MKNNPNSIRPKNLDGSGTKMRLNRFKPLGLVVTTLLVLSLIEIVFLGNTSPKSTDTTAQSAAIATQAPLNNALNLTLPDSKNQAAAFVSQHASPFNFDQVNQLIAERAVALGQKPANNAIVPASSAITPRPTQTVHSGNLAPAVIPKGLINNAAPNTTVCGPDSQVGFDGYETD